MTPIPDKVFAVDTEVAKDGRLICTSMSCGGEDNVNWEGEKTGFVNISEHFLNEPKFHIVFHNAKFDLEVLTNHGYHVAGEVHCTMLMAKCLMELLPSYSLKSLGYYFLGDVHREQIDLENWFLENGHKRKDDMGLLPRSVLERYTKKDVRLTIRLFRMFWDELEREGLMESYNRDRATIWPVLRMERNKVLIDRPWVKSHYETSIKEQNSLRIKSRSVAGNADFNINSNQQLAKVLTEDGHHVDLTPKGNPKLDKKARKGITHEIIEIKNRLQDLSKQTGTYCTGLMSATRVTPWVQPNFNISFAATRRFSSSGRDGFERLNWQNIPPEMRRAVVVPKGEVGWFFDYKQIENVIHIFYSDDAVRRQAYLEDENWSEYLWLAEQILGEKITKEDSRYKKYKSGKLGMNYGLGAKKFGQLYDMPLSLARTVFSQIRHACPAIQKLQNKIRDRLLQDGSVRDVFGYIYHGSPDKAYKIVAYLIQGCAAALMKAAIVRVDAIKGVKLRLTVHDELFVTMKNDMFQYALARRVRHAMTDFSHLFGGLPIRVEAYRSTTNWLDKKAIKL